MFSLLTNHLSSSLPDQVHRRHSEHQSEQREHPAGETDIGWDVTTRQLGWTLLLAKVTVTLAEELVNPAGFPLQLALPSAAVTFTVTVQQEAPLGPPAGTCRPETLIT
ncbi:MAG TPA: hypothetical protein VMS64_16980 [Candidatus Methylomirabilis sp.]|nr:hypothetical protein [Candidatus Methylomirabilis sp.]